MNRGVQNDQVMFSDGTASMCTVAPPGQSGFVALTPAQLDQHLESTKQLTLTLARNPCALHWDDRMALVRGQPQRNIMFGDVLDAPTLWGSN